jgi:filamentous hemagglutinin family protein
VQRDAFEVDRSLRRAAGPDARRAVKLLGVVVEKSKSSLLSSSIFCVRQMVLRVGFKFKLTMARVRTPAPSRLLLALLAGYGVQAMALPTGGQVASGNVTIAAPAGGSLNITQTTDKGIVNWQTFNVGSGETVNFLQPSASSSTLNRVVGNDASTIFGQINANGQVFLVNTSGILFAPGAQVNTAGLVASTLQLQDSDYLSGNYSLTGSGGSVDNQGVIKAGFVALAGAQVSNTGTIVADGGMAALAAGGRVTLNLIGSDLVSVSVDAPTAAALVHSGGIVQADGGQVLITAKAANALLDTVVNVDGIVQAHSIGSHNGVITLDGGSSGVVNVSGTLDASGKAAGQTGGTVKVVGANVGLFDATVDASGDTGGGVVRVGGDWHGAGADGDANASQTIVAGTSLINANAITSGNGGNVVVWSQDRTQFTGAISATGGRTGGDGGAVETSAHDVLQVNGVVDLSAAAGNGGTWLLDPNNIAITTGANAHVDASFTSTDDDAVVNNLALGAALTNGTTVNITTASAGTNAQSGDISVQADVTATLTSTQSATLNLNAQRNIAFTGANLSGGSGSLTVNVNAGTDVGGTNTPGTNASTFSMDSSSSIATGAAGNLNITTNGAVGLGSINVGGNFSVVSNGGNITQSSGDLTISGGATFTAGAGSITVGSGGSGFGHVGSTGGATSLTTGGSLVLDNVTATSLTTATGTAGSVTQTGGDTITATTTDLHAGTGGITLVDGNTIGTYGANTTGAASFTNATGVALGSVTAASLSVNTSGSNGNVTQASGDLTVSGATAINAGSGAITVGSANSSLNSFGATGGAVSVTTNSGLALDNVTASGLTVVTNGGGTAGAVTQTLGDSLNIGAGTGAVLVSAGAGNGAVTLDQTNHFGAFSGSGGAATVDTVGALSLGAFNGTSLTVGTSGAVAQSAALTLTGDVSVTTSAGSITLDNPGNSVAGFAASTPGTATLVDTTGVALRAISAADLAVTADGDVTQSADLAVSGTTGVNAGSHDVTLTRATNSLGGLVTATGTSVAVAATGDLDVNATLAGGAGATGNLSLVATGVLSGVAGVTTTGNVTLSSGGALATAGAISGQDVSLTGASLTLNDDVTANGNLALQSAGAITQTAGVVTAQGTSTLTSTGAGVISLADVNNFVGDVTASGGAVTLVSANALTAHLTTATSADLTAQGGVLTVDGSTAGALSATGVGVVLGTGTGTSTLGVGTVLTANSGTGSITQGNTVTVGTTSTLDAGSQNVNLGTTANTFGGLVTATGTSVSVAATGNLDVNATLSGGAGATGNLTLSATQALTGLTAVTTSGDISLSSGTGLTTGGALSGNNVMLAGGSISIVNNVTALGNLVLNSTGAVTQDAPSTITAHGTSTLTAGTSSAIALTDASNDFIGAVTASGGAVSLTDAGALTVDGTTTAGALTVTGAGVTFGAGTTTVNGALGVTSTGAITQSGKLIVTGGSTLDAGANAITLADGTNHFGDTVSATGGAVSLSDVDAMAVHLAAATGATLIAGGVLTVDGGTTGALSATGNGVVFGATTVDGTLTAVGGSGSITQTGVLSVANASSLSTTGQDITLATATNNFQAPVTASGANVTLVNAGALTAHVTATDATVTATGGALVVDGSTSADLTASGAGIAFGATTVHGALTANSSGAITQTGALAVSGASGLDAGANAITLTTVGNDFGGLVTAQGGVVQLTDTNAMAVALTNATSATLNAGGVLTVVGSTGDLNATANGIVFGAGTTSVGGALNANSGAGSITQDGASTVAVAGLATLNGGNSAVTLANGTNDFGTVAVSGGAVSLTDANTMTVHLGTVASGTLVASGALTVDGATGGALATTGNGVVFGTTTVGGALTAHSGTGTISQTGSLAVAGTSALDAGTNAIALGTSTNDFGGAVTVNGGSVNLADANALTVHLATAGDTTLNAAGALTVDGTSTAGLSATGAGVVFGTGPTHVAGALVVSSGSGAITQSGALVVGGASTLDAGTNAITLTNAGNDFTGGVSTTGDVISLTVANALAVHLVNSTSETFNAGGVLSVDGSTTGAVTANGNGVVFGATSIGGALVSASGTGTLTQTGPLAVTGTTTLNAGTNAITLTNAANDFAGAVTATGGAVSLTDANALTAHVSGASAVLTAGALLSVDGSTTGALSATGAGIAFGTGTTTVHGALTATSTGAITQSGDLVVNGTTAITATGQAVTLNRQTNQLGGAVTVAAAAVDIEQAGALTAHLNNVASAVVESGAALAVDGTSAGNLTASGASVAFGSGTTSVGGNLAATSSGGDITQAGTLAVTGTSALAAGTGNVNLAATGNVLAGAVTAAGASVTLADQAPLTVHVAANGSATLTSAGALSVDGSSGAMTLNGTAVSFGAPGTTVSGALAVTSAGITQSGSLAVTGATQLNAGAGAIALDAPGTNLQGTINATGGAIRIVDTHAIDAALNATGDVVLSSGADVAVQGTFQGGLNVTGANVSLNAGTGTQTTSIGGLLGVTSSGNTTLGNVSANGATLAAGGSVLLGGTLTSSSDVTITGKEILGVATLGALDVTGATANVTLDTRTASGTGGGNIGKAATTVPGAIDAASIIALIGTTGQHGIGIYFNPGQSAWFRVTSQTQAHQLIPHQPDTLNAQTFFCDTQTCVNVLGQTTAIADSVISNILSAASQDAADAAFGTENLDFAIRKGYVTTIGRVPPGIDEIAGDLGATPCDSRVTSPTSIAADKACSAGK